MNDPMIRMIMNVGVGFGGFPDIIRFYPYSLSHDHKNKKPRMLGNPSGFRKIHRCKALTQICEFESQCCVPTDWDPLWTPPN